jgi:Kef-type K+ transport system membrane component KefB/Trk K+ transport system NAD-binding subunit
MINNIFLQISILLGITVSIAAIMRLLRQPIMIAYIIAGIVAGPLFFDLLEGTGQTFDAFAEFGVVLLLFVVGLSLNFNHIKKIGKVSLITGLAQAIFTATAGYAILRALHFSTTSAAYLAIAMTFSSTIIIVKLLNDKKTTESVYGRHVLGLMIVQDILAISVMMVITSLNGGVSLGEFLLSTLVKMLTLAAVVFLLARFALPRILDHVAHSSEFLFIFTVAWCFGLASLLHWAGFSLEIGAIVAGLTLGSSPYQAEISSRVKPLRDFFIVLFFIILGSEMGVGDVGQIVLPAVVLSLFILIGNPFILYHTFRLLKFTRRNSFLAGITAAQVSEFGFILLFTGYQLGLLSEAVLPVFTSVALITIFVSSYAVTYSDDLYRRLLPVFNMFGPDKHRQQEEIKKPYHVWVFGYHRMGWKICEALKQKNIRFAVVDFNPKIIERLQKRGIPAFFGDAADVEFLESLPLHKAKLIISTLPEAEDQLALIAHLKKAKRPPRIIVNLYHNKYLNQLYAAGADYVMMPHLLGGSWIAHILRTKPWTKPTFEKLKREQEDDMKLKFTRDNHTISS